LIEAQVATSAGIANVFCTESEAAGAWAEDPAGAIFFATSNRRSTCFRSDEETEAMPAKKRPP